MQVLLALVNQIEVVHIPAIEFYPHLAADQLVHAVQIKEGKTLVDLISGRYGMEAVSGPVGTVSVISEVAASGFVNILYLFAFISLNLGVMNLLPLPALDGGRILFTLVECVIRRPLNPKFEGYVHLIGMILLLGFMAVITVFDVMKLF